MNIKDLLKDAYKDGMTLEEMIKLFSLDGISKSPSIFILYI